MNRLLMSVLVTVVAGVGFAENYEYTWDAANPQASFGDGLVTLVLDGSTVTAMNVTAARGDTVTFSGNAMAFDADATVTVSGGALFFANDVTAAGDISFITGAQPGDWVEDGTGLLSDQFKTVLTGLDLEDVEILRGHLTGSAAGGEGVSPYNADAYFVTRGEGWMEVQLQQWLGTGNSTKVVKVRLEQDGDDVKAKILYGKYVLALDARGLDFDQPTDKFVVMDQGIPSSTAIPKYHYGCNRIHFLLRRDEARASAKVSGVFTCAGKVNVGDSMVFGALNRPKQTIGALDLGVGSFSVETDENATEDVNEYVCDGWQPKDWNLFAANQKLLEIDTGSIAGKLAGSSLSSTPVEAWVGYFKWSSGVLSCQFQYKASNSAYAKGLLVKFRQAGDNVEFCPVTLYYCEMSAVGEKDFEKEGTKLNPQTYATSYTSSGYCIAGISGRFKLMSWSSSVNLTRGGETEGGVIAVRGASATQHAELRISNSYGLPTNGVVEVAANGVLSVITPSMENRTGVSGGTCEIRIGSGGLLRQGGDADFPANFSSERQRVFIDGGVAEFGCECTKAGSSSDAVNAAGSTYLNFLTLRNGAYCFGRAVRMGNSTTKDSKWTVSGSIPSVWDASISLLGISNASGTDEFEVEDTTGSDEVDFTVTGDMKMFKNDAFKRLHVKKTGAGTMKVCGDTDFTYYPLEIAGGTWMVGSETTMTMAQNIQLSGGAFASADGVNAAVGKLLVGEAGGGIVAGANSTVSFLDSSDQMWIGMVNVTCPKGSFVRFGTSASALTAEQKGRLRINGKKAVLDEDGYAVPSGLVILLK